eukprot:UN03850
MKYKYPIRNIKGGVFVPSLIALIIISMLMMTMTITLSNAYASALLLDDKPDDYIVRVLQPSSQNLNWAVTSQTYMTFNANTNYTILASFTQLQNLPRITHANCKIMALQTGEVLLDIEFDLASLPTDGEWQYLDPNAILYFTQKGEEDTSKSLLLSTQCTLIFPTLPRDFVDIKLRPTFNIILQTLSPRDILKNDILLLHPHPISIFPIVTGINSPILATIRHQSNQGYDVIPSDDPNHIEPTVINPTWERYWSRNVKDGSDYIFGLWNIAIDNIYPVAFLQSLKDGTLNSFQIALHGNNPWFSQLPVTAMASHHVCYLNNVPFTTRFINGALVIMFSTTTERAKVRSVIYPSGIYNNYDESTLVDVAHIITIQCQDAFPIVYHNNLNNNNNNLNNNDNDIVALSADKLRGNISFK